jgi:PD-(D/E)XK nuclease superfamily
MVEAVANGLLKPAKSADDARRIVETAWDSRIAEAVQDLRAAWPGSSPPAPDDWPGYHITRVRIMRRALQAFSSAERGAGWARSRLQIEKPLKDSAANLWGRPDRVEGPPGHRAVADLKTGLGQASATAAQRRQLLLYAHLVAGQTGDLPRRIAIEDASGRRWEEPVDPDAVQAIIQEVETARSEYESAATHGDFTMLAQPSPDNCRLCPYRPVCRPYWSSLETNWLHGSLAGVIAAAKVAPAGSVITVDAASPIDSQGQTWTVSAVREPGAITGRSVTIVDAELTGAFRHLRCRWRTTVWLVPDSQPAAETGTS